MPCPVSVSRATPYGRDAWSAAQRAFLADFKCRTRPASEKEALTTARMHSLTLVKLQLQPAGHARLAWIACVQPSRGHGGATLDWLCALADRHAMTMDLQVCPATDTDLPLARADRLEEWYRRRGFRATDTHWMMRPPVYRG